MTDLNKERTRIGTMTNEEEHGLNAAEKGSVGNMETERSALKLTVNVEIEEGSSIGAMELMRSVRELCGGLVACRFISAEKYEVTVSNPRGKERLIEGFKIGDKRVYARELNNDELIVSFMNLPFYIEDREILAKLQGWGVSAVSPIKRRMWPNTNVADGTRYLKVRFNDQVQSLPYSARFKTAQGMEYFRVIHDKQQKVCRMCMQPGHILRECPDFTCHKCGVQGHYARECSSRKNARCSRCLNDMESCICNEGEEEEEKVQDEVGETGEREEDTSSEESTGDEEEEMECAQGEEAADAAGTASAPRCGDQRDEERQKREKKGPERDAEQGGGVQTKEQEEEIIRKKTSSQNGRGTDSGEREGAARRTDSGACPAGDAPSGAALAETAAGTPEPQTPDSDSDGDLAEKITQLRKRQNTERQPRINKKSKSKNKR